MHEHKSRIREQFAEGQPLRAERNVLAAELKEHPEITEPYALATYEIKKGARVKNRKAVKKELKRQRNVKKEGERAAAHMAKLRMNRNLEKARKAKKGR
jgi:hypothetical protein